MKEFLKYAWEFVFSLMRWVAITFYTTLVLQILWNWFVTTAFHLDEIGYWNMYGLVLLISVVSVRNFEVAQAHQWFVTQMMIEACIPEAVRAETRAAIDKAKMSEKAQSNFTDGLKVVMATFALVVGWAVHTFLM